MVSKQYIPVKDQSAYPMGESDWVSLREFVLAHSSKVPRTVLGKSVSDLYRRSFKDFQHKGWILKYRHGERHYLTACEIKSSLKMPFSELPKHTNLEGVGRLVILWRLEVGK